MTKIKLAIVAGYIGFRCVAAPVAFVLSKITKRMRKLEKKESRND